MSLETVFTTGTDPIRAGFVTSISRPEGNVTGVNLFITVLEGKRIGLLRALVPGIQLIAVLPDRPTHATEVREVQEAVRAIGQQMRILLASNENAINAAFATATQLHAGAMLVGSDPMRSPETCRWCSRPSSSSSSTFIRRESSASRCRQG